MRFQRVIQVGQGLSQQQIPAPAKFGLTSRVDRGKWCMWNGKPAKGLRYLHSVQAWLTPRQTRQAHALARVSSAVRYLVMCSNSNRDSLPNSDKSYQADQTDPPGLPQSTFSDVMSS